MEFPQFEFIIKRIFYFFLLLIVFALAAVFWFMYSCSGSIRRSVNGPPLEECFG